MRVRRGAAWGPLLWCAVAACWVHAGCLDAGPPPVGRHLLASRDESGVELVPAAPGAARRILLRHAQTDEVDRLTTDRVSTVADPAPARVPVAPRVLLDQVGQSLRLCTPQVCRPPVDAAGRLYLDRPSVAPSPGFPGGVEPTDELVQVDPDTGGQQSLGFVRLFDLSSGGTRVVFLPAGESSSTGSIVVELDGSRTTLPPGSLLQLVDEDVFFVTTDAELLHLPAGSTEPAPLAASVQSFYKFDTERGSLVLLRRSISPDGIDGVTSLFDPTTLTETAPPPATASAQNFVPSPSGRYLVSQRSGRPDQPGGTTLTFFDRDTTLETRLDLPWEPALPNAYVQTPVWRPGHEEVWFLRGDEVWRWRPDAAPVQVASDASSGLYAPFGATSPQTLSFYAQPVFTPDGRFRVVVSPREKGHIQLLLRSADDPAAEPVVLNPDGTGVSGVWPLVDGRLLVEAWITDPRRNDVYLIDPDARVMRALASTGNVVATGRHRFLGLQHWVGETGSGDLTSIDYATGSESLIAQNVYSVAIDRSPVPDDALAPGTRVVYLTRNRIASPYDGCWSIDLP